jgi:hypothetical protein
MITTVIIIHIITIITLAIVKIIIIIIIVIVIITITIVILVIIIIIIITIIVIIINTIIFSDPRRCPASGTAPRGLRKADSRQRDVRPSTMRSASEKGWVGGWVGWVAVYTI